ncbi:peroxiredoxin family protein [Chryseosolibacter indicus]|uniref:Redoxin domain-containing protein n=1 Tax=Chryseosolibacter indicus TaxID=2782351 RepID=A0ABS5VMV8_9BACT|nr:redoxin domain-containing protein [Chryseosolibacter indicus]MBT1702782.1 redoxin domain-containing protein [Chryseosolibacter indicus]
MKLANKQQAPDFTVTDISGKTLKLSDFKGKKVHLGFFRNVSCPFCNLRVHQLSKLAASMKDKGLESIYFFESKPDVIRRSSFHQGVSPIPLVGDPERKIYTQYGIEASVTKMLSTLFSKGVAKDFKEGRALDLPQDKEATQSLIPADFLIDENGVIVKAYYGSNLNDHISIDEVKAFAGI